MSEQQAEPACHATTQYIALGRPSSLPDDVISCFPSQQRPYVSGIQELAGNGRLHTTDDGIVLLVRQLTSQPPPDSKHLLGRVTCLCICTCCCSCAPGSPSLPFDSSLPHRDHAYSAYARTFSLVDWCAHLPRRSLRHCVMCQARNPRGSRSVGPSS